MQLRHAVLIGMFAAACAVQGALAAPVLLPGGGWRYDVRKDPINDSTTPMLILLSSTTTKAALAFECHRGNAQLDAVGIGNRIEVTLLSDEFLRLRAPGPVAYRFDSDPPVNVTWHYSEKMVSNFESGGAFATYTAASKKLVLRVEDYRGRQFTYAFDLAGAPAAIARLKTDCAA